MEERKQPLSGEGPSGRRRNTDTTHHFLTVQELQYAATVMIKATQATALKDEIKVLSKTREAQEFQGRRPRNVTSLQKLNPFLDKDGVLHVGGHIRHADLNDETKFRSYYQEMATLPNYWSSTSMKLVCIKEEQPSMK